MWSYSQTSAQVFAAVQNVICQVQSNFDGKYWFSIKGHNSIMSDCKTVSVCVLQRQMLDKNDHINILSPTFSQNSVFNIKNCILFIASEYIFGQVLLPFTIISLSYGQANHINGTKCKAILEHLIATQLSPMQFCEAWMFSHARQTNASNHLATKVCVCVCVFRFNVAFNNFSVISRWCLVAIGSSMLTFIVLPHWSIMSQTLGMIPHPVILYWHWVDQS